MYWFIEESAAASAGGAQEYTDSGTVSFKLTPLTADVAEFADTSTVYCDLQASGTDVVDYIDASTVSFSLTPSATDIAEYIDAELSAAIGFLGELGRQSAPSGGSTLVITLTEGASIGSLVVVGIGRTTNSISVNSVTDSRGNTYNINATQTSGSGARSANIATSKITTALQSGDTITITFSSSVSSSGAIVLAFSNIDSFDTATTVDSGAATTFNSGDLATLSTPYQLQLGLVFDAATSDTSSLVVTPEVDWSALSRLNWLQDTNVYRGLTLAYRVVSSRTATGGWDFAGTFSASVASALIIASYKSALSPKPPLSIHPRFNGTSSYGTITDNASVDIETENAFTWAGWVKFNSYDNNVLPRIWEKSPHYLCIMGDSGNARYRNFALEVVDSNDDAHEYWGRTRVELDVWYHVAIIFDGSQTGGNQVTLQINGNLEPIHKIFQWPDGESLKATTDDFYYARRRLDNQRNLNGLLAGTFYLYKRALSLSELLATYNGNPPTDFVSKHLVSESSSTVLNDLSTYDNDVTLNDVTWQDESTTLVRTRLQPSGTETYESGGIEYTDGATVYVSLIPSSTDIANYIESATVYADITPSSTDVADFVDSTEHIYGEGTYGYGIYGSGQVEFIQVFIQPSATEDASTIDAAEVYCLLTPSVDEERQQYDAAEVYNLLTVTSEDVADYIDSNTVSCLLTPSGDDVYEAGGTEYTDSGTVGLNLTPGGVDAAEYVDANTVYNYLVPSSVDTAEFPDAAEVYFSLVPSSTDVADYVDTTVHVYGEGTYGYGIYGSGQLEFIQVFLQPSGSEDAAIVDEAEVYFLLTPSAEELREQYDEATVDFRLIPTSSDLAAYIESAEVYNYLTPSGVDTAHYVDTGRLSDDFNDNSINTDKWRLWLNTNDSIIEEDHQLKITCETTALDTFLFSRFRGDYRDSFAAVEVVDAGTPTSTRWTALRLAQGTHAVVIFTDGSNLLFRYTTTGSYTTIGSVSWNASNQRWWRIRETAGTLYGEYSADGVTWSEIGNIATPINMFSMILRLEHNQGATQTATTAIFDNLVTTASIAAGVHVYLTPSGVEGEQTYTDSATVYCDLQPSTVEVFEGIDAAEVYCKLIPSAEEVREIPDEAEVYNYLIPSSTDVTEYTDAVEVYNYLTPASTEELAANDTNTIYCTLTPSSTDVTEYIDTDLVYISLTPSSSDEAQYVDVNEVYIDLVSYGEEEVTGETSDAAEVYCTITPESIDVAEFVDTNTVRCALIPATEEAFAGDDAETIVVTLSVATTDAAEFLDTEETYLDIQPSGTEYHGIGYFDAAEIYNKIQIASIDIAQYVDAATAYIDLEASGITFRGTDDAATAYVDLDPSSVDIAEYVDAALTTVILTPYGVDQFIQEGETYGDVYLHLTPSATEYRATYETDLRGRLVERRWYHQFREARWRGIAVERRWYSEIKVQPT